MRGLHASSLVRMAQRYNKGKMPTLTRQRKLEELRKKATTLEKPDNITTTFDQKKDNETLKLAFLIMTYLYSQDDQKLSKSELKDIKQAIKENAPDFTSDDLIEVYAYFKQLPDMKDVLAYISSKELDQDVFYTANEIVLDNYKDKDIYVQLLKSLRDAYKLSNF